MLNRKKLFFFAAFFSILYFLLFATVYIVNGTINQSNGPSTIDTANLSGKYDESATFGEFLDELVNVPAREYDNPESSNYLADISYDNRVLGDSDNAEEKRIEVDLTNQKLYAFEGDHKVYEFLVSTGKWGLTPTGEFRIWTKLRYTKMSGGSKALRTYYYLPNVPFTMFFSNAAIPAGRGFGIHGTYWHNNFGHPMSHGCINMKNEDVEKLYYWANPVLPEGKKSTNATKDNPGTKVVIYGVTPKS